MPPRRRSRSHRRSRPQSKRRSSRRRSIPRRRVRKYRAVTTTTSYTYPETTTHPFMRVTGLDTGFPINITKDESPILGFPIDGQETSYILVIKAKRNKGGYDIHKSVQLPEDGYSAHRYISGHPDDDVAHIPCYTSQDGVEYYECVQTIQPTDKMMGTGLVPGACIRRGLEACICVSQTHVLPLLQMTHHGDLARHEYVPFLNGQVVVHATLWYYPLPNNWKLVQSVDVGVAFETLQNVNLGDMLTTGLCGPLKYVEVTYQSIAQKFNVEFTSEPPILEAFDRDTCTITCLCDHTMHLLVLAPPETPLRNPLGELSGTNTSTLTGGKRVREEDDGTFLTQCKAQRKLLRPVRSVARVLRGMGGVNAAYVNTKTKAFACVRGKDMMVTLTVGTFTNIDKGLRYRASAENVVRDVITQLDDGRVVRLNIHHNRALRLTMQTNVADNTVTFTYKGITEATETVAAGTLMDATSILFDVARIIVGGTAQDGALSMNSIVTTITQDLRNNAELTNAFAQMWRQW